MIRRLGGSRDVAATATWGVAAYGIHEVGNQMGFYLYFGWYQNLTHAASASALAALIAVAGLRLGLQRGALVAFVVGLSGVGFLAWELVEYLGLLDPYGVALHFHDFHDAAIDMVSNAVGLSLALGVVWIRTGFEAAGEQGGEPRSPTLRDETAE